MPLIYDPDLVAYSGGRVVKDFTASTVDSLIQQVAAAFVAGGFTQLDTGTDSGHPFYHLESLQSPWVAAGSPPSDYGGYARVYIHAYDNAVVRISVSSRDGSIQQPNTPGANDRSLVLQPDATHAYRVINSGFQSVIYTPGYVNKFENKTAIIGCPHTPAFLQSGFGLRECLVNFSGLGFRFNLWNGAGASGDFFAIRDNAGLSAWSGQANDNGSIRFIAPCAGNLATTSALQVANAKDDLSFADPSSWFPFISPPMLAWGTSGSTGPIRIKCWLWDAILVDRAFPAGTHLTTADGHVFEAFTDNNTGQNGLPGTLFFCVAPVKD
jgi:hypothetical protein